MKGLEVERRRNWTSHQLIILYPEILTKIMSSSQIMIFDMDLQIDKKKLLQGESSVPTAPPPSPNSSNRRKFANPTVLPMSRLIGCCEELVLKQNIDSTNLYKSKPVSMKRKTSDSDGFCSSSTSSSAGTSPGATSDYSCSFGKRSRSSFEVGNISFRRLDFSMSELSAAINASQSNDVAMEF